MKKYFILNTSSVETAIKQFNKYGTNSLIVINKKDKFLGVLSNGDLRKGILKKKKINFSIDKIYNSKPTFYFSENYEIKSIKSSFIKKGFDLIPILNSNKKVVKIFKLLDFIKNKNLEKKNLKKTDAVIMAGGLGTRMIPFTDVLPKPLIPLSGKPVINHIMENFEQYGIKTIWITLNYKRQLLKSYLRQTKYFTKIKFFEEKVPLGTVGALKHLKKLNNTVILTNCDTIINTNLHNLLSFHKKNNFDITIVASIKNFDIPYGVCKFDEKNNFIKLQEKPNIKMFINSGMYVLNKNVIKSIPLKKFDMNVLIHKIKQSGKKIGVYPVHQKAWIDVGNWKEYQKSKNIFEK